MAASYMAFKVSCSMERRPSISHKFEHFNTPLSSVLKPILRELHQVSIQIDASRAIKDASVKILDAFVDLVFEFAGEPLLPSQSNFAPVEELNEACPITEIEGKLPDNFPEGVYIRNGAHILFGRQKLAKSVFGISSHVWVEGEGMLHALYLSKDSDGRWSLVYNNKYVESETFLLEKRRNKPSLLPAVEGDSAAVISAYLMNLLRFGKVNKDYTNTNIFEHAGKYYSIAENHQPHEFDIFTLKTFGNWDVIHGAWNRPFNSHPKRAPDTGELVIMGVDAAEPFAEVGIISADGKKLVHKVDLKMNRCSLCHEMGITLRYNVILDFPLTIDLKRLFSGDPLVKYMKEEYARIGLMPRYSNSDSIRWFEVLPNCTFYIFNAFEDQHEVVIRGCKAHDSIIPGPDFGVNKLEWFSKGLKPIDSADGNISTPTEDGLFFTRCYEWRLNMQTGEVKEGYITGTALAMDFPFINEKFIGIKNKYGYTQVVDSIKSSISGMIKYGGLAKLDFQEINTTFSLGNGHLEEQTKVEYHMFEENTFCTGATFASNQDLEEDDGWIIAFVHNEDTNISQVRIIDANHIAVQSSLRISWSFHANLIGHVIAFIAKKNYDYVFHTSWFGKATLVLG